MNLASKRCVPCEGDAQPLKSEEIEALLIQTPLWEVIDDENGKIGRVFTFKKFSRTMAFVNAIAALAEEENHHPDMYVSYGKVIVELWTHAIGGLSENDFIMAAKIDRLPEATGEEKKDEPYLAG
jgi:4a-hydroxytetrahydrobiopterin dehydratase